MSNHYHFEMVLYKDPHYCVLHINEEPFELQ